MTFKETNKYLIPVEISKYKPYKWLNISVFEYKLHADANERRHSVLRFLDINGIIIGEHMPTKLHTVYDKAANQVKNTTTKAIAEMKQVADVTMSVATDIREDVSGTAKQMVTLAANLFDKVKAVRLKKIKSIKEETKEDVKH